jgi:ribosome-associated toxin RatA of RatAB toxin-antitoxin module
LWAITMFANRLSSGTLAVFLALPLVAPAAAAPATLSVSRSGDEIVVVATAEVAADKATTWDVLTRYDRLPDFIPDMAASRTLERDGSNALVLQSGRAGLGPFKQEFSLTLAVHEVWQQSVTARAVAGDFRRFESSYRLSTDGMGCTRIEYSAVIEPIAGIPPLVGLPVMRSAIRAQFEALLEEIDRRAQLRAGRVGG